MNKHLHRIVFNAARGMRMVVQETARSAGKASGATPAVAAAALATVLLATPSHAQIAGAMNVPNAQRPTVLVAPNGVPLVNIQTPSAAGVSRNVYHQFDVMANGAILNNSRSNVQTQLGGWVQGNPYLATGPARIILNEINSGNPTQLRGYVEVGGQRAEVIIANPAGINVDGGGFINASRATLTTGTPQLNALGGLDSFLVRGGTITIDGAGLDASKTDYAAILARAVQVNAGIWASELKVVTGANQIGADHAQITPTAGTGAAPTFALDVSQLGGMYANKIVLVGTEAGVGARNAGSIGAGAGGIVVTAAGRIENTGTLEGQRLELASAANLDNRGGTIRQTGSGALTIAAPALSNTNGGVIGAEPVAAGSGSGAGVGGAASTGATGAPTTPATGTATDIGGTVSAASPAPAYVAPAPGSINAAGTVYNDGGRIYAGGPVQLQTPQIDNAGGTLSVASMAVSGARFSNAGGTLNVASQFSANVGDFDNTRGTLRAGNLQITTSGDLLNVDGTLTGEPDARLTVGGKLDNTRGTIASGGDLTINAGSVQGSKGTLQSTGNLTVTAAQGLTATGTNVAGGNASLQGAFVDLSGSQTGSANIAITATQGDVITSAATVATPGTLAVTANAQAGQTLANSGGTLNAGQLQINASNIANTNGGEIVQTGTGATSIVASGTIDNSNSRIASNGQDLTLQAARITSTGGKIEHAGTGVLTVAGGSFNGAGGEITGNGALVVNVADALVLDGGSTYAQQVDITAGSMSNRGGKLQAAGTSGLSLTVADQLDNSAAGQMVAGGNSTVRAGSLVNDSGAITAVGNLAVTVSGAASNQGGTLAANSNTSITASSLNNNGGTAAAVNGDLTVTTGGTTSNVGGTLQAGGVTTLANAGLNNSSGKVFGDSINVDTRGRQLTNALGTVAATQGANLQTGYVANDAGLIQSGGALVIDTHGQGLGNTNAAGYAGGKGGIASGDTLTLTAGGVNNAGGFIGAKGAIVVSTQGLANTGGGQIVGESSIALDAAGNTVDNSGGQVQAVGALTVNAAGINNTGGLLRSTATTTLDAADIVNANTLGTDRGIEGNNVSITAVNLGNTAGAIRASNDVTVTASGLADNTNGLMSAGGTLALKDPNAANSGAKTLNVVNTGGTLIANQSVQIDAARFSGDGTLQSGKDLAIALTQDIVNNADVIANGNLSYGTTGKLTNNGKLVAGDTLTVNGNVVENTVNAEMSGKNTTVNAGTLNNRGLIDSFGKTQVNASLVNNVGSGRLYGNDISVATGTLTNDAETVNGVTRAGTIAARNALDIGATTITNREHALIFSGNRMAIGGALDAKREATGQGATLNNLSASIESLGDMKISMAQVNNWDTHVQLGAPSTKTGTLVQIAPFGKGFYDLDQVIYTPGSPYVFERNPDGSPGALLSSNGYGIWNTNYQIAQDTAINADPARIVAGGNLTINGHLHNRDSRVVAGGTLTVASVNNEALQGTRVTTASTLVVDYKGGSYIVNTPTTTETVAVGAFEYTANTQATSGYNSGAAPAGTATGTGGAGAANGGTRTGTIVEVPANVGSTAGSGSAGAGAAAGQTVPMVVRTSTPNLTLPQASLFRTTGGGRYLIETDPRFAGYRLWLSSDYLLERFGLDPNNTLTRLGDGFYEQQLVRDQIAQLTGYRYLDGYTSDDAQYTALMNAGVTFAQQFGLRPGVALSAAQMAQLTSDIVWLVEQTVTLADGSRRQVLVPQVYVRVRPGDIDGSGALLAGNRVNIDGKANDFINTGTVVGRQAVSINANTLNNLGGRIAGGSVDLKAQLDINNIGGSITARDKLSLDAGRDLNVRTTTQTNMGVASGTNIDRVAGLYVTNPGGTLVASAGRDINLVGAIVANAGTGSTSFKAGNDINLGTVTVASSSTSLGVDVNFQGGYSSSKEIGTRLSGGGNVALDAKQDVNARAATVSAGGDLNVTAGRDITIESGRETSEFGFTATWGTRGVLTRTTNTVNGQASTNTAIGSNFSGTNIAVDAGRDINVVGSDIHARGNATLDAVRNVNIVSALEEASTDVERSRRTTGGISPKPGDASFDVGRTYGDSIRQQTQVERASNITASNNLSVTAGKQANIYASNLSAGNTLDVTGAEVNVISGTNATVSSAGVSNSRDSIAPTLAIVRAGHGLNNSNTVTNTSTSTTLAAATLSGRNVNITATTGDITLAAANINASDAATLNATQGDINFNLVRIGTELTQSRGEGDLMYARSRNNGLQTEAANYTQINAGQLTLNAQGINVQVGRNASGIGQDGPLQYTQGVQDALARQIGQPGMGWLTQIQNDPALANVPINWGSVPLAQRQWAEGQGGLTQTGAAVVTIVASIVSYGAASGWGAAAGNAVGGGAVGTTVGAAVQAGIASIASQATVSLINNNGDIGAVINELGSSQGIRRIVTSMATAGVVQGLDSGLGIGGWTTAAGADWTQVLGRNLLNAGAGAVVSTAINGGSLGDNLGNAFTNALISTGASTGASVIGSSTAPGSFGNLMGHAIAGCIAGAIQANSPGCGAGAMGATIGEMTALMMNGNRTAEDILANGIAPGTVAISGLMGGLGAAIVSGGNANLISIATAAGSNAAENNQWSQLQTLAQAAQRFGQGGWQAVSPAGQAALARCAAASWCSSLPLVAGAISYLAATPYISNEPTGASAIPGQGGFGAGGVQYYGPPNTGATAPPPYYGNNTGGDQISNPYSDGIVVGGGYGAGGVQSYSGPTTTPINGPSGPNFMLNQGFGGGDSESASGNLVVGGYRYTGTAGGHAADVVTSGEYRGQLSRPYLTSPSTIDQIISTGLSRPDPGGVPGGLRYEAPGSFRGSQGNWELVIDPSTNTIYHFNFVSSRR